MAYYQPWASKLPPLFTTRADWSPVNTSAGSTLNPGPDAAAAKASTVFLDGWVGGYMPVWCLAA